MIWDRTCRPRHGRAHRRSNEHDDVLANTDRRLYPDAAVAAVLVGACTRHGAGAKVQTEAPMSGTGVVPTGQHRVGRTTQWACPPVWVSRPMRAGRPGS